MGRPMALLQRPAATSILIAVVSLGLVAPTVSASAAPPGTSTRYTNPVSKGFADTFADPAVIRGKDGFWYSYGTSDPLREGENVFHRIPIARSTNLVDWFYVGDAFADSNLPTWADRARNASIWAPDIRYVDGQYRMYYVVTETTATTEPNDNAIGMATAPTPAGPWTDSGAPVVGPRRGPSGDPGNFQWTFDPSVVTDTDGSQWLFYGSYYGGIHVIKLSDDGKRTVGTATQVAIDNKFEGAYVIRRGHYWYFFASTANCCAGPTTGYSVHVGRSRDLRGPYRDREGVRLNQSRAGGTPTLVQNGNRWIGAGHNAVVTDLAGQDWIVYHAIRRGDPYLDGTEGVNERPMLLDRLDWIRGWPQINRGAGPSATDRRGPVTRGEWFTRFTTGTPSWMTTRGAWSSPVSAQGGGYLRAGGAGTAVTRDESTGGVRVEADVRSSGADLGLVAGYRPGRGAVRVLIDEARVLRLQEFRNGRLVRSARAALPGGFTIGAWHSLNLQIRGRTARGELTHARLADPLARITLRLSRSTAKNGRAGFLAGGAGASVDNLSVLRPTTPQRRLVTTTLPNRLIASRSDEFSGSALAAGWTWVRQDTNATVSNGALRWPTQNADLVGTGNNASGLLRNPGRGSWVAETKLTIDLGTETVRNYQQGGLIAYVHDDHFTRLSHVAIWNTRQTEFGKEMPYAQRTQFGGTIVGPPSTTTWLRISHRLDPNNDEHELRAWTSRNGKAWVKGGVWTLPPGADVRVGLVSQGGAGATAQFDYFRLYR